MRTRKWLTITAVVLAMTTTAWWLHAAPIRNARPKLPDEIITLHGLREIRLKTVPLGPSLTELNVTKEMMRAFEERLVEKGFEVTEKQDVPIIQVSARLQTNSRHPDIIAVYFVVDVHQRVRVYRIDQDLTVPTISISHAVITTPNQVADMLEQEVRDLADRFNKFVDLANR